MAELIPGGSRIEADITTHFEDRSEERERSEWDHMLMTQAIGSKLFLAPMVRESSFTILDVGGGTGPWIIEMANKFPRAQVVSYDIDSLQPFEVPKNVRFQVEDVEEEPWSDGSFDFIFCRNMVNDIRDWPHLTREIYDHVNSGGWAEFQDFHLQYYSEDGTLTEDHKTRFWNDKIIQVMRDMRYELRIGSKQEALVKEARFQNVTHRVFRIPIGSWPKDKELKRLGAINLSNIMEEFEWRSKSLLRDLLKWSEVEFQNPMDQVRAELKDGAFHGMINFHVTYGQKP